MIDILFFVIMAFAVYKGLSRGFIVAFCSVLGFIIGLAAALKLSTIIAAKLNEHTEATKWMPMLAFILVFVATAIVVNMIGKIVQKTFETAMLGWANRIAGVILYCLIYSIIFSIFIFYAVQLHFVNTVTTNNAFVYPYTQVIGPKVIEGFGVIIPWFKNMFSELEQFFGNMAIPVK